MTSTNEQSFLNKRKAQIMDRVLLSVKEAANALGIGRTSTYLLIKNGTLKSRKVGRRRLVKAESVRRLANGED